MSPDHKLTTSSLLFICPGNQGFVAFEGTKRLRYKALSLKALELAHFFLEARSVQEALAAGYSEEHIRRAIDTGLLIPAGGHQCEAGLLWERNNWSRAAYLQFSQMDLTYLEPEPEEAELIDLTRFRRDTLREYEKDDPYPPPDTAAGETIDLPRPSADIAPDLDALLHRRSVRQFHPTPVALSTFGETLFEATRNYRAAETTKGAGDRYYLLNSFYSWLRLSIAVQGVDGIERGIYRYDPASHKLFDRRNPRSDAEIASCIQDQTWIGGSGWCIFVIVAWQRYMWLYRHSRAYINLLIQLGEFGQELLFSAYSRGLGGWVTPAITESAAAELIGLDSRQEEAMYFIKIGRPLV